MRYLLILLFILTIGAYADKDPGKVEIFAGAVSSKDDIFIISDDVIVAYGEYVLTAKKGKYDKQHGILELFDNVRVSSNNHYKTLGKYARLDLKNKKRTLKPFYFQEASMKVWVNGEEGCYQNNMLDIKKGVMSGCDPQDPLWQIQFSSSEYNTQTKWVDIYNATFYLYDIPVLYTPYFGYSLDTTRRTGLLTPSFGYSDEEGIFFQQPLYIAEQNWWDLEFDPQIRTDRGAGIYTTFRFVDSKVSHGSIKVGYFKEKNEYFQKYNLANQTHYGMNIDYINNDFLNSWFGVDHNNQAVIYVETNTMNDVEYINLATNNTSRTVTHSQAISRANIFYNTDEDYTAAYFKYYIDLNKEDNSDTLQQLPTIQYHRYLDTFFDDHLLYNVDLRVNNLYRSLGTSALQTNLAIPLAIRTSLFDEYLNISYQTQLYGQYSTFATDNNTTAPENFDNGYYVRNYNLFTVSSEITKAYPTVTHSINLSGSYIKSGFEERSGFYEDNKGIDCNDPQNQEICEFYNITDIKEAITLNFSQYFFNRSNEQIIYHRLTDIIYKNDTNSYTSGALENELDIKLTRNWRFYNNFLYDFDANEFSKQYNKLSYENEKFRLSLAHLYKKDIYSENDDYSSYITSTINYKQDSHFTYFAAYDYDTVLEVKKRLQLGFLYNKRCWEFGLNYVENNRPILTQDNTPSSIYDRYIYVTLVLKPFMKATQSGFFGLQLPKVLNGS
ncbi:MAG: LPS-assembly protein LptD [Epsilonproteobacteria bacterium]|nr:LPS-assembly protein LptD [Campylobacterota bacterium]